MQPSCVKRSLPESGDDQNSPESLIPAKDPYSSDDDTKLENGPRTILFRKNHSAEMKAEHVQFFLNVTFNKMMEEIPLEGSDIESCLAVIFQFISGKNKDEIDRTGNPDAPVKYNKKTMRELTEFYLSLEDIKWLIKYDNLNYETTSVKDIVKKRQFLTECGRNICFEFKHAQTFALNTCNLYVELMADRDKGSNSKHLKTCNDMSASVKNVPMKSYLHNVALMVKYEDYKQYGRCINWFPLRVRPDDIPEGSPLVEDRRVDIVSIPDGVFTVPIETSQETTELKPDDYFSKIVVEVYDPTDEDVLQPKSNSRSTSKVTSIHQARQPDTLDKPRKTIQDCICDSDYCSRVRQYIKQGLPLICHSDSIVDKMAGKHVMQLFCQAFHNKVTSNLLLETELQSNHFGVSDNPQSVLGMFIVDEYIYFSRLEVNGRLLDLINGFGYSGNEDLNSSLDALFERLEPPQVNFAPFRLDITESSHRHALIIFLREYLYNYSLNNTSG